MEILFPHKVKTLSNGGLIFFSPGCKTAHAVNAWPAGPKWTFNNSMSKPTFTPSILVTYNGKDADQIDSPPKICHSFVTDGNIQFLNDCTHSLSGQTVEIPEWPYKFNEYGGVVD